MKSAVKWFGIVFIMAAFTACDDSGGSNNQANTNRGLTIYYNSEEYEYEGDFICARGIDAVGKQLIAALDISGSTIVCAQASAYSSTLNVWEVKDGKFIPYSGSGIAFFNVFVMYDDTVSYNKIMTLDEIDCIAIGYTEPSFVTGLGFSLFEPYIFESLE